MEDKKTERIVVERISKKFDLHFRKQEGALARILSLLYWGEEKELHVLRDISLRVFSGDSIGIIGKNGCGKSTLLRIIAGIYRADKGIVKTNGNIIYLTGFFNGLNDRLTMWENIYLVGAIYGLSQREIKKKFDEIVSFSGLNDFVDTKLYQFSSGMLIRLGFSIVIHCLHQKNPDILLIDEAFTTGGDIEFQQRALGKMEQIIKSGASVLLASHSLDVIQKYCDKVLWIDDGVIAKEGKAGDVVEAYMKKYGS